MRKFIICTMFVTLCSIMVFAGCTSAAQTLAKNLDDTVTNLIYTVSSLDWADSETLKRFNMIVINDEATSTEGQNNQNVNGAEQQIQYIGTPLNPQPIAEGQVQNPGYTNISPFPGTRYRRREKMSKNTRSYIPEQKTQNTALNTVNAASTMPNNLESMIRTVNYSTEDIERNNEEIYTKISDLISKRGNLLIYINALYNSTAKLSEETISAINAYINLIKENTSYLKSNKGIITNQLSQASDLKQSNINSPLINAYIIRTNEALETRIAKLSASIDAIDAINDILSFYITNPIKSKSEVNSISNSASAENNQKIVINNKNANISQDNTLNSAQLHAEAKMPAKNEETKTEISSEPSSNTTDENISSKSDIKEDEPANDVPDTDSVEQILKQQEQYLNGFIDKKYGERVITK